MAVTDPKTSSRRRLVGIALVVALAAVLIAVVVTRSGNEKVINAGGDTHILVGKKMDGGLDALATGRLADVQGCLGLAPADGSGPGQVVIWPHGTNVDRPDPLTVKINGKNYRIGDVVKIGGGQVGPLEPSSYFYDQVPTSCRSAQIFDAADD